ncbi:MAG: NADH-ubiquinone oxidoreductase-F iron-sulfur binding region domain-containing protein [Actinomycetota bacterium]
MSSQTKIRSLDDLKALGEKLKGKTDGSITISVCSDTSCKAYKSGQLYNSLQEEIGKKKDKNIVLKSTGCHGFCERGPVVMVFPQGFCYLNVCAEDAPDIVAGALEGQPVERLLYQKEDGSLARTKEEIPFYSYQQMVVLGNNPKIDPKSIEDYLMLGGYQALGKVLAEASPQKVIDQVKESGLRGRGGGGFPTGLKWEFTSKAEGSPKYVIVNADEGDPGAFMDRSILDGNPHSVIEGLAIGAYAIGANQGFIYIRQEYPMAVEIIREAIRQAREYGFIGKDILGSGFDFDIKVHRGAGAFVSGESSALTSAIEGHVGEPRLKYIHTSESGLWAKPTNLNNVETWANVPLIISKGPQWFKNMGTEGSSGTKIFSLVGKVNNTGLVEVPMGITLRDIIFKVGGGIKDGKQFKAVQTGGPSGGVLPAQLLDLPVDFDELDKAGSMMGSGGMIVMDETSCMVNVAHYFIKFLSDESCGKCVPCREGLRQILYIYDRIMEGKGTEEDLKLLADTAMLMEDASLCALGSTAPNIILSTLKYFRQEYEAHIYYGMCPALVCKPLIKYTIDEQKCTGCTVCVESCPVDAIKGEPKSPHYIEQQLCIKCGTCEQVCPERFAAISRSTGIEETKKVEVKNKQS